MISGQTQLGWQQMRSVNGCMGGASPFVAPGRCGRRVLRIQHPRISRIRSLSVENGLEAAPIEVPAGPWSVVDGGLTAPGGFSASGITAGLRGSTNKPDLSLVFCENPAVFAGVFTQNVICAAPVTYCKQIMEKQETARAILTNAGQANAVTGSQGYQDTLSCVSALGKELSIPDEDVLIMSTGVIGQRIKVDELISGIPELVDKLGKTPEDALKAAVAMTTTDLVSKSVSLGFEIDGIPVHLGGACKGSGMIHPNMATMLGIVTCDIPIEASVWREMLRKATKKSFNMITVDGDTSTNDTVLALSSGTAQLPKITDASSDAGQLLQGALDAIMQGLAKSIAWDGEGATCLLEVRTTGAKTENDAILIAKSVASSMLTKAAVFGNDPNWGRIACAAGYSGVQFSPNEINIYLGPHLLMLAGTPQEFNQQEVSNYLKDCCSVHGTVEISVSVGDGPGEATSWGCDLSYDYVKINAEYTT